MKNKTKWILLGVMLLLCVINLIAVITNPTVTDLLQVLRRSWITLAMLLIFVYYVFIKNKD